MEELTQKLSNGEMVVQELPMPQVSAGTILVKNHFSLLSPGTEGSTVKAARKSLIGKAKERPQQVKQVLQVLKAQGLVQTYRAVMKKLDAYSPLGYSCAGEVMEVADDVRDFHVGDLVACAGLTACHAEVVAVPVNLCVKLKSDADLSLACYNTLGSIAMQGVRQADLRLGETCVVIGLGLIGQLVCLELKASGVRVVGVDVSANAVKTAREHCCDMAFTRDAAGIEDAVMDYTYGIGADAVIIAAATSSLDPINFAGALARKRGKVVVLGAVPTGFDRDPYYYKKELDVRMSCSYGPGRYDINYEEKGIDYPAAYVRWTEKRNMEAFQELIYSRKIDISYLTTHTFDFEDTPKAYDMVANRTEPYLGIVLKYNHQKQHKKAKIITGNQMPVSGDVRLGFVGAGSYAQSMLLPNLPSDITRVGVLTNSGSTSKRVAEKYGFGFCTGNEADIFENNGVNTLFVATRHDSHAKYVLEGLEKGMRVYVEKPLCLTSDELRRIMDICSEKQASVMIGFNRRFSPLSQIIKKHVGDGKMAMIYRANVGHIPSNHWIQDPTIGGGRIIGEACHFIDYLTFMCGSIPVKVTASAIKDSENLNDTANIMIEFENGSVGTICYYANGSKAMPKEYVEVYSSGTTAVLDDFKSCKIYGKKVETHKLSVQNKGQKNMVEAYFNSLRCGKELIPMREVFAVTAASLAALTSIREGSMPVQINL